uniref:Aldo/keto reductase n=1 Tax=uncultured bacterium contig00009 TaxID=1181501 RepID=A0A806K0J1_9BACT|nr:aldo/keto reductase [uncultured bacterium contig00009]
MRYKKLGKTNLEASILGFGAMRLPMVGDPGGLAGFDPKIPIDEARADKMVQYALDKGVNYFDTAYGYHGGKSETYLGKILHPVRTKVLLVTKLPVWNIQKTEDFERIFQEQLGKLQTDYLDVYLVHSFNSIYWEKLKRFGVLEFLDKLKADGRIRAAGFSFHDEIKVFKQIIDAYDWDAAMIQYNFYDQDYQAGREGLRYAAGRGLGVIAMEPLRGGKLVNRIPGEAQKIWDSAAVKRTPAEWGMRWVWNHPEVSVLLSGASSLDQVRENTEMIKYAEPNSLTAEELDLFDRVRGVYRSKLKVDCTSCAYCMPCPAGVDIMTNFQLYNEIFLSDDKELSSFFYNNLMDKSQQAVNCTDCGACAEKCPQKIDIARDLKEAVKMLGKPAVSGQ